MKLPLLKKLSAIWFITVIVNNCHRKIGARSHIHFDQYSRTGNFLCAKCRLRHAETDRREKQPCFHRFFPKGDTYVTTNIVSTPIGQPRRDTQARVNDSKNGVGAVREEL